MRKTPQEYVQYTPEQIQKANEVNLIEYAERIGYQLEKGDKRSLHAKKSGGLYFFPDSNKYYHFTTDKSGGVINFVMQFENKSFPEAVEILLNERLYISEFKSSQYKPMEKEKGELIIPEKAPNFKRAYWYLCSVRGIAPEIVSRLMNEGKVYQQNLRGNCVFIGFGEKNKPRYCAMRGTSDKPFKMDATNSDKSYPFVMEGSSKTLFVLESPIDVMSHASLYKLYGHNYAADHRISLGCLSDRALERHLKQYPEIKKIVFALDNDIDGTLPDGTPHNHGQKAAKKYAEKYKELGYRTETLTPEFKDFNEDLMVLRSRTAVKQAVFNENVYDIEAAQ